MKKYDVLVIGGGPSGASTGYFLAKKGLEVLLCDSALFPRQKACGGLVSRSFFENFSWLKAVKPQICVTQHMGAFGYLTQTNFVAKTNIYTMSFQRRKFDATLLKLAEKAGVEVREGVRIRDVHFKTSNVSITGSRGETLTGRMVVGADGVNSIIAKKLNLYERRGPEELGVCAVIEYPFPLKDITDQFEESHAIHIFPMFMGTKGYGWIFPKTQVVNIGIGGLIQNVHPPIRLFRAFLRHIKKMFPLLQNISDEVEVSIWPIPLGGPLKKTYTDGGLVIGDAAGLVNPLTGAGIENALFCGKVAADTIASAPKQGIIRSRYLHCYQTKWYSSLFPLIKRNLLVQNLFTDVFWSNLVNVLTKAPVVRTGIKMILSRISHF